MKKQIILLMVLTTSFIFSAHAVEKITVDGKKIKCKGTISIENATLVCDGQPMQDLPENWWASEEKTVCGFEQVITHENGGGMKSVRSNVYKGAFLDKESVVCGTSMVRGVAKVMGKSHIDGAVHVFGNSEIKDSKLSGAVEIHSSKITNAKMMGASTARSSRISDSVMLGASKAIQAKISNQSNLSGAVEVKNSEINGSTIDGASFVFDNSTVLSTHLSGAIKVQHCKLNKCTFTGANQIKNQTCTDGKLLY